MSEITNSSLALVFWTCGDINEARSIAHLLLEKKLVACVNIIPQVESIYLWREKLVTEQEVKVIFKTLSVNFEKVRSIIVSQAEYEVSEVTMVCLDGGNSAYFDWIKKTLL
jgi:periplasmic divalent cation tolerance protein